MRDIFTRINFYFIVLGLYFAWQSIGYGLMDANGIGPGAMPLTVAVILIGSSILDLVFSWKNKIVPHDVFNIRAVVGVSLGIFTFAILLLKIPLVININILLFAAVICFKNLHIRDYTFMFVIMNCIIYVIFQLVLDIDLGYLLWNN